MRVGVVPVTLMIPLLCIWVRPCTNVIPVTRWPPGAFNSNQAIVRCQWDVVLDDRVVDGRAVIVSDRLTF